MLDMNLWYCVKYIIPPTSGVCLGTGQKTHQYMYNKQYIIHILSADCMHGVPMACGVHQRRHQMVRKCHKAICHCSRQSEIMHMQISVCGKPVMHHILTV